MRGTTPDTSTPMSVSAGCSLAPATNSCCARSVEMPASSGGTSLTTASTSAPAGHKKASTARSSGMRASTYRHRSWSKRMQSLISSGLIAGITPTSIAQRSPQGTLDIASSWQGGGDADGPQAANSCLSDWLEPRQPPCEQCGAMTAEEADTKCLGAAVDDCHGNRLWPDVLRPNVISTTRG